MEEPESSPSRGGLRAGVLMQFDEHAVVTVRRQLYALLRRAADPKSQHRLVVFRRARGVRHAQDYASETRLLRQPKPNRPLTIRTWVGRFTPIAAIQLARRGAHGRKLRALPGRAMLRCGRTSHPSPDDVGNHIWNQPEQQAGRHVPGRDARLEIAIDAAGGDWQKYALSWCGGTPEPTRAGLLNVSTPISTGSP